MIAPTYFQQCEMISVGTFGKSVGLKGGVRVFLITDFPEILQKGVRFYIQYAKSLTNLSHIFDTTLSHNISQQALCSKSLESNNFASNNKTSHNNQSHTNDTSFTNNQSYMTDLQMFFPITLHKYHANIIEWAEITTRQDSDLLRNLTFYSTIAQTRELCSLAKDEFFYFDIIGLKVIEENEILGIVQDIQKIANTDYFVLESNFLIPYIEHYVKEINLAKKEIYTQNAKYLRS